MKHRWIVTAMTLVCAPLLAQAQDAQVARSLAANCSTCHSVDAQARGGFKSLDGWPAEQLITLMARYKDGSLPATLMQQIAKGYSEEQVRLIAGYFAAQQPRR